jgi:hypothetical protein
LETPFTLSVLRYDSGAAASPTIAAELEK